MDNLVLTDFLLGIISLLTIRLWLWTHHLQVWADPAGNGDAEASREFVSRADRAADHLLQKQVQVVFFFLTPHASDPSWCAPFCPSWFKVTEHLSEKNIPVFQPGAKVRTFFDCVSLRASGTSSGQKSERSRFSGVRGSGVQSCFSNTRFSCSWRTKSGRSSKTNLRWARVFCHSVKTDLVAADLWPLPQGFNDGLEELCKTQKGWAIPDKEQRDFIRRSQKRAVSEAYRVFLQRWAPIPVQNTEFGLLFLTVLMIDKWPGLLVTSWWRLFSRS